MRLLFKEKINHYQAEGMPLVYLDESGFVHDMPRLRGYAPVGQRCYGVHDWKAYGRTNAIGALIGHSRQAKQGKSTELLLSGCIH